MKRRVRYEHAMIQVKRETTGHVYIDAEEYEEYLQGDLDINDIISASWQEINWEDSDYEVIDHRYEP